MCIRDSPFKVPIPNKILERNGQVKVEFSLSKESELITVNKTFNFEVIMNVQDKQGGDMNTFFQTTQQYLAALNQRPEISMLP